MQIKVTGFGLEGASSVGAKLYVDTQRCPTTRRLDTAKKCLAPTKPTKPQLEAAVPLLVVC